MTSTLPETITRGDLVPTAVITIGDDGDDVDFSSISEDDVWVICEQFGEVVLEDHPDSILAQASNKELVVTRSWQAEETSQAGRMYIWVAVEWPSGRQTFPETPLILDIRRAAGDA